MIKAVLEKNNIRQIEQWILQGENIMNQEEKRAYETKLINAFTTLEKQLEEKISNKKLREQVLDDICLLANGYEELFFKIGLIIALKANKHKKK